MPIDTRDWYKAYYKEHPSDFLEPSNSPNLYKSLICPVCKQHSIIPRTRINIDLVKCTNCNYSGFERPYSGLNILINNFKRK